MGHEYSLSHYRPNPSLTFTQTIPVHLNAARENADSFNELAKEVEVFPRKVASALKVQAQSAGILETAWNAITQYVLNRLATRSRLTFVTCGVCVQVVHRNLAGRSAQTAVARRLIAIIDVERHVEQNR